MYRALIAEGAFELYGQPKWTFGKNTRITYEVFAEVLHLPGGRVRAGLRLCEADLGRQADLHPLFRLVPQEHARDGASVIDRTGCDLFVSIDLWPHAINSPEARREYIETVSVRELQFLPGGQAHLAVDADDLARIAEQHGAVVRPPVGGEDEPRHDVHPPAPRGSRNGEPARRLGPRRPHETAGACPRSSGARCGFDRHGEVAPPLGCLLEHLERVADRPLGLRSRSDSSGSSSMGSYPKRTRCCSMERIMRLPPAVPLRFPLDSISARPLFQGRVCHREMSPSLTTFSHTSRHFAMSNLLFLRRPDSMSMKKSTSHTARIFCTTSATLSAAIPPA